MTEQRGRLGHDVLGLALFGLAAFTGVSVAMAVGRPVSDGNETTALVVAVVRGIGALPGAFLCLGLVVLGARLWLWGVAGGLGRHLLGLLGASLALSVVSGAMAPGAGGALGGLGEVVTRQGTVWLGVPFGLLLLALPLWFAWIRPRILGAAGGFSQDEEPLGLAAADAGGVSAAEADALLPEAPPEGLPLFTSEKVPVGTRETDVPVRSSYRDPSLPPLYPEDVRRTGGIPEGARPLETPHETSLSDRPAAPRGARGPASLHQPTGATGALDPERPGADLAAEPGTPAPRGLAPDRLRGRADPAAAEPLRPRAPAPADSEPGPEDDRSASAPAAEADHEPGPQVETPPPPSWEQPSLFAEDPVDAYGTPVSLVERLRQANQETLRAAQAADEELDEDELADDELEEPEAELQDELEDDELEDEQAPDVDEEALEDAARAEDLEDDADEDDADEDDEADEDEADDGDVEHLAGAASGEELASEPEQDEDPSEELEESPVAAASLAQDRPEDQPRHQAEDRAAAAAGERDLLVPAAGKSAAPKSPPSKAAEPAAAEPASPDRYVELRPRKVPAAAAAEAPADADDLVYRAGALFLERGRVAVSMLQREFGVDFKQATDLLDRLQAAGLIGPYLGGKRRDILLTAEQWGEQASGSRAGSAPGERT